MAAGEAMRQTGGFHGDKMCRWPDGFWWRRHLYCAFRASTMRTRQTLLADLIARPPADRAIGDQPLRRGDDDLRRHVRADLPRHPRRPRLGRLLDVRRSRTRWACGRTSGARCCGTSSRSDLRHGLAAVLVRRPDPRPGHHARPRQDRRAGSGSTAFFALGWRGSTRHWQHYERAYLILAGLATPLVLSVHSIVSMDFAVVAAARLAHHDLPALLRRRRHLLRLRHGGDADGDHAARRSASSRSSPCSTSTTWRRSCS